MKSIQASCFISYSIIENVYLVKLCEAMRTSFQKTKDLLTFPIRAFSIFHRDRWGLSSLATERFDYVSQAVRGYCLDVGCGRHNRFVKEFLKDNGKGIDLFAYEGLTDENLVTSLEKFPFPDKSFDSVTFIACINHVPEALRLKELKEAFRVLRPHGNVIVTMGNPLAELAVHQVVWFYDKLFGTDYDMDTERGMEEGEEYFLTDVTIRALLEGAGFTKIEKRWFLTQWGLNHLLIGWKK